MRSRASVRPAGRERALPLAMVVSCLVAAAGLSVVASAGAAERTMVDLPDDLVGHQLHVLYVLPSDSADEFIDVNGYIASSIGRAQIWLEGQSGRTFRVDAFQGQPDITFFRLRRPDAQMRAYGPAGLITQIAGELLAAGFSHPNKLYVAYYGGTNDFLCGGQAYWPPTSPGNLAVLYLHGARPDGLPCVDVARDLADERFERFEFGFVHEVFHALGAVPTCAPHQTGNGHVSDDPHDIMTGAPVERPPVLDVGHDDYFGHPDPACLDVADSAFLEPPTVEALPPRWPVVALAAQSCSLEATLRSGPAERPIAIQFQNATDQIADLSWLDAEGRRWTYARLQPGESRFQGTFIGHPWVFSSLAGDCLGLFETTPDHARRGYTSFAASLGGEPTVRVIRSASHVRTGDPFRADVDVQQPVDRGAADLYIALVLSDGQTIASLSLQGQVKRVAPLTAPREFVAAKTVVGGETASYPGFLEVTVPPGLVPGTYYLVGALVRRGAFGDGHGDPDDVLAIDIQPVTLVP